MWVAPVKTYIFSVSTNFPQYIIQRTLLKIDSRIKGVDISTYLDRTPSGPSSAVRTLQHHCYDSFIDRFLLSIAALLSAQT
ncbi:hypothetical protein PCANC_21799 [Puccinia coronata f. sp. avenae]|uniref:Uncharacterized protein n=1 Tax=Puccinia coronata f. sp. avenae TaxID=200324 RepID=A0A2N5S5T8_9BASI|nr:hypothetical protein PCANC_21799 [Puccinia coronata f. sp. avenae]